MMMLVGGMMVGGPEEGRRERDVIVAGSVCTFLGYAFGCMCMCMANTNKFEREQWEKRKNDHAVTLANGTEVSLYQYIAINNQLRRSIRHANRIIRNRPTKVCLLLPRPADGWCGWWYGCWSCSKGS